jgi:hypothetical protein
VTPNPGTLCMLAPVFIIDQLLGIDADRFAAGIEQWAATVTWVDGRIGLNPGARHGCVKAADGTDDSLGNAEEHGITGIADGQDVFSLWYGGSLGKRKMREAFARRLCQGNIGEHPESFGT